MKFQALHAAGAARGGEAFSLDRAVKETWNRRESDPRPAKWHKVHFVDTGDKVGQ